MLDGQDVTEFSRKSLREQLGYVEQDAPVLAGTIRDNLLLGRLMPPMRTGRGSGAGESKGSIGARPRV